jgi:fatty acid omega-hydroxylase
MLKTKFESFVKGRYVHDRLQDILGNGIFTVDGHSWKYQRKTAANIFSVKNFREFVGTVFKEEMDLVIKKIDDSLDSPIDVHDLFFRFTLDGFAKIGFGTELNCMNNQSVPFAVAFDRCQATMDFRFFSPLWKLEEMVFFWKKIQLKRDMKTIRDFGLDLIRKRQSEGESPNNSRADLLTLFMRAKDADGKPFSDELLCDFILNFIIAGRDTTAQALSWAI